MKKICNISKAITFYWVITFSALIISVNAASIDDILCDISEKGNGDLAAARQEASDQAGGDGTQLGYHSTEEEEGKDFSGDITPPELADDKKGKFVYGLAIFSDDGCDVAVAGKTIHSQHNQGQGLPNLDKSFHVIPTLLPPGEKVSLAVTYSNKKLLTDEDEPDIDGCTLFLFLMPVDLVVRKKGTAIAPATGLIVEKGDDLEFAIGKKYFDQEQEFEDQITWEFRQLKGDGTYNAWDAFGTDGKGSKFEHTTAVGGIFQLRIEIGGSYIEFIRDKDAPNIAGSNGIDNTKLKEGEQDFVGVVSKANQITIRDTALAKLGSKAWAKSASITVGYGVDPTLKFAGSWKCNIFVFMMSNASGVNVPTRNWRDYVIGIPPYVDRAVPPGANDWYNPTFAIPTWTSQASTSFPEPGWAAIHQYAASNQPGGAHIGLLDYDGTWINAGQNDVNKSIHITDAAYQSTNYRKP
ncbi:hypothetical protein [Luteolibacter sp. AS25]|uniref:hypothetical protein n=1 Tax=Luteolibacter sp. AS25 TaxID=3135776 RepID=UPI00398B8C5E